ncbi:MAG: sugar transferase [Ruminococcus sp.]|nr:sugar transferase [Ruminococcus sp.]
MYKNVIKRVIDIFFSGLGIIILAVPMVIISVAIKIDDPGPVLFKQKRYGKNKKYFNIIKFRSMFINDNTSDIPTHLLENPEAHITRVGAFLRKTSLDEIPQLFNIFIGDMSIVGPRPAVWNYYDMINERDKYGANDIKPGLTGWAQINGRDEIDTSQKARFDGEYVKRMSFLFDCKCIFLTIPAVLKCKGVVEGGRTITK